MKTAKYLIAMCFASGLSAQQTGNTDNYDYYADNRQMIQNGVQAVLMCNGLFTSNRTLEQVYAQELAFLNAPVGTADGGDYAVDRKVKTVQVGDVDSGLAIRAAYRDGIGCVVMAPDQTVADITSLPSHTLAAPDWNPEFTPWPLGDAILPRDAGEDTAPTAGVDAEALLQASDWAFDRESAEQVTLSLLVLHKGKIVHERYADGVNQHTRTRTWSTAKSIAATLIGMLVDAGRMQLDKPLPIDWLPELVESDDDPRQAITLRHVLNMSSGLYPVDSFGQEYVTGSGLSYWAGASSVDNARKRGLVREPGAFWDYENYDTLLAVYAMKQALGSPEKYTVYPRRALLDRIGMRNTLLSTDRFGDFILSSQVYSNARDLARFGQLYLQNGVWQGERLVSEAWIDFVRTPAPATADRGGMYGGHFWLVPQERKDVPKTAYATAGNRGQYVVIIPSHDTVIVRRGLDYGKQGFNRWDMTREVLKAITPSPYRGESNPPE